VGPCGGALAYKLGESAAQIATTMSKKKGRCKVAAEWHQTNPPLGVTLPAGQARAHVQLKLSHHVSTAADKLHDSGCMTLVA
jgi:hypothetical protein